MCLYTIRRWRNNNPTSCEFTSIWCRLTRKVRDALESATNKVWEYESFSTTIRRSISTSNEVGVAEGTFSERPRINGVFNDKVQIVSCAPTLLLENRSRATLLFLLFYESKSGCSRPPWAFPPNGLRLFLLINVFLFVFRNAVPSLYAKTLLIEINRRLFYLFSLRFFFSGKICLDIFSFSAARRRNILQQ